MAPFDPITSAVSSPKAAASYRLPPPTSRPHPERRETSRPPGAGSDEIRNRAQHQDCQSTRLGSTAECVCPCRRGDRMKLLLHLLTSLHGRYCSLIPGFSVKLSAMILAGPTVLSAVGACPPHDGVRRRWWINVASAVSLIESSQKIGRSHHRHRPGRDMLLRVTRQPPSSTS
jgi:hypothetical protein